jgi:hypothetical protein
MFSPFSRDEVRAAMPVNQQQLPQTIALPVKRNIVFESENVNRKDYPEIGGTNMSQMSTLSSENDQIEALSLVATQPANGALDVCRQLHREIGETQEMKGSLFIADVEYTKLIGLDFPTSRMSQILRDTAAGRLGDNRQPQWIKALHSLENLSVAENRAIMSPILAAVNAIIPSYYRTQKFNKRFRISTADDLYLLGNADVQALVGDVNDDLGFSKQRAHIQLINRLLDNIVCGFVSQQALITSEDPRFGDFVHCDAVNYESTRTAPNGAEYTISKYDYGTFSDEGDRSQMIRELTELHTVFRVPSRVIFTNCIPLDDIYGLYSAPNGVIWANENLSDMWCSAFAYMTTASDDDLPTISPSNGATTIVNVTGDRDFDHGGFSIVNIGYSSQGGVFFYAPQNQK